MDRKHTTSEENVAAKTAVNIDTCLQKVTAEGNYEDESAPTPSKAHVDDHNKEFSHGVDAGGKLIVRPLKRKAVGEALSVEIGEGSGELHRSSSGFADGERVRKSRYEGMDEDTLARMYAEHCAEVEADRDAELVQLTFEEFVCQTEIDEKEFGPGEDPETIFVDAMILPYPHEQNIKLWKLRSNRWVEVQRLKRKRLEMDTGDDKSNDK